jgi:hypothetical protein
MKTRQIRRGPAPALLIVGTLVQADRFHTDPYVLEPRINGGVSATGLFASPAGENEWLNRVAGG